MSVPHAIPLSSLLILATRYCTQHSVTYPLRPLAFVAFMQLLILKVPSRDGLSIMVYVHSPEKVASRLR